MFVFFFKKKQPSVVGSFELTAGSALGSPAGGEAACAAFLVALQAQVL